ncbi:MAG: hypothetical protein IPJ61_14395 [Tessaracoccus sp.]|uniref:hypothetical protein n=1 Tax=Tessaracoccus sp. TaxID=1971211 RepID=UPI001EB15469|nr:hypothetical protein [Tessaracoccus sp.]MBK7822202.1 hypothetical protein [Tessaracoccus sp.]
MIIRLVRRVLGIIVAVGVVLGATGCELVVTGKYQPLGLPISFSVNTRGEWAVAGEYSVITPIGRFELEAAVEDAVLNDSDDALFLTILSGRGNSSEDAF